MIYVLNQKQNWLYWSILFAGGGGGEGGGQGRGEEFKMSIVL